VTDRDQKKDITHSHIKKIIKKGPPRSTNCNWSIIPTPQCDHSGIDVPFTEEEVKTMVNRTARNNAPGPDASWVLFQGLL
jgi:hypothetical protein